MTSMKVTLNDVSGRHCYGALRKETEGLEKLNFTKDCINIAAFCTPFDELELILGRNSVSLFFLYIWKKH